MTLFERFDKLLSLEAKYRSVGDELLERVVINIERSYTYMYGDWVNHWYLGCKARDVDVLRLKARRRRVRKYVRGMVDTFEGDVYLMSLTFNDDALGLLSEKTRERYVREYLNRLCLDYFACIDFGKVSGREHYHALVALSPTSLTVSENGKKQFLSVVDAWPYGFSSLRRLHNTRKDVVKSCAYAFKASNYAFKNADSEHRPFHKRGVKHWFIIRDDFDAVHCPF